MKLEVVCSETVQLSGIVSVPEASQWVLEEQRTAEKSLRLHSQPFPCIQEGYREKKRINHTSMLIVIAEILGEPLQVWHGIIFRGCCPQRETLMNKFQRKKFGLFNKPSGESCCRCRCYYRFQPRSGFSSVSARVIYHLVLRRL